MHPPAACMQNLLRYMYQHRRSQGVQADEERLEGLVLLQAHLNNSPSIDNVLDKFVNSGERRIRCCCKCDCLGQITPKLAKLAYLNSNFFIGLMLM